MLGMLDLAVFILSQCFYFINIRHCFLCFLVMINTCCFLISNQVAKGLHGILPPHEDIRGGGVRGAHLSVPVEVCLFLWTVGELLHMGEVTIRDFPGGTLVPISYPIGQCRTEVCKSEFNKLSQRSL